MLGAPFHVARGRSPQNSGFREERQRRAGTPAGIPAFFPPKANPGEVKTAVAKIFLKLTLASGLVGTQRTRRAVHALAVWAGWVSTGRASVPSVVKARTRKGCPQA